LWDGALAQGRLPGGRMLTLNEAKQVLKRLTPSE
jgi:hypothetical protein